MDVENLLRPIPYSGSRLSDPADRSEIEFDHQEENALNTWEAKSPSPLVVADGILQPAELVELAREIRASRNPLLRSALAKIETFHTTLLFGPQGNETEPPLSVSWQEDGVIIENTLTGLALLIDFDPITGDPLEAESMERPATVIPFQLNPGATRWIHKGADTEKGALALLKIDAREPILPGADIIVHLPEQLIDETGRYINLDDSVWKGQWPNRDVDLRAELLDENGNRIRESFPYTKAVGDLSGQNYRIILGRGVQEGGRYHLALRLTRSWKSGWHWTSTDLARAIVPIEIAPMSVPEEQRMEVGSHPKVYERMREKIAKGDPLRFIWASENDNPKSWDHRNEVKTTLRLARRLGLGIETETNGDGQIILIRAEGRVPNRLLGVAQDRAGSTEVRLTFLWYRHPRGFALFDEARQDPHTVFIGFNGHANWGAGMHLEPRRLTPDWWRTLPTDAPLFVAARTCNSEANYWADALQGTPHEGLFTPDFSSAEAWMSEIPDILLRGLPWSAFQEEPLHLHGFIDQRDIAKGGVRDTDRDGLPDNQDPVADSVGCDPHQEGCHNPGANLFWANQKAVYILRSRVEDADSAFENRETTINLLNRSGADWEPLPASARWPVRIDRWNYRLKVSDQLQPLNREVLAALVYFGTLQEAHAIDLQLPFFDDIIISGATVERKFPFRDLYTPAEGVAGALHILRKFEAFTRANVQTFCEVLGLECSTRMMDYLMSLNIPSREPLPEADRRTLEAWIVPVAYR